MSRFCRVGPVEIGAGRPLTIIAGPCVLESLELGLTVGRRAAELCQRLGFSYVFKASFDKANRSSIRSARGPGIDQGLDWLSTIRAELGCPVTTDIHERQQAVTAAGVVDLLQIPAFLCRQTDLLVAAGEAAARSRRAVNVKKGQFLAPHDMTGPLRKLTETGCKDILFTERGTTFGYGRLINDFLGLGDLMQVKVDDEGAPPVCFDVTHSTQTPGLGGSDTTQGRPDRAPLLARAAVAAGVHALFIESHTDPRKAMSDAATQIPLEQLEALLEPCARVFDALR
jgi:2-dehydro-3-deoxyphosphooctonate aldolase (KDO 8-P synthase)